MIRYDLRCDRGHDFDSWFQSSEAFDRLNGAGHVSCPECGSVSVAKALMAPSVATREPPPRLDTPRDLREAALMALRREIEANSEYVGLSFAAEARAIHEGRAPERQIHGEAKVEEARRLIEDGVPVAPLPFVSQRRAN
ncbi:MAG: DUF1178 family protein [Gemmobacter sp.]